MDKVQSYEQIQGFVSDIRSLRKGYVSNFFWDPSKHPYWIEEGSLSFLRMDNCVLMIHQQEDFCNLFYIATDMETVSLAVSSVTFETTCVVDVVSRGEGDDEKSLLLSAGFSPYQHLCKEEYQCLDSRLSDVLPDQEPPNRTRAGPSPYAETLLSSTR